MTIPSDPRDRIPFYERDVGLRFTDNGYFLVILEDMHEDVFNIIYDDLVAVIWQEIGSYMILIDQESVVLSDGKPILLTFWIQPWRLLK